MVRGDEVQIPFDGGSIPAYASVPAQARRGVVVIHEIFGRQPEIDRVVDRFADAGYAAAAPDLFADGKRLACIARVVLASNIGWGRPVDQALATRRWLTQQAGLGNDQIGLIGFCLGGGFALAIGRGWGAVSANYGTIPPTPVMRGIGPTIACYGGRDRAFARMAPRLKKSLDAVGAENEVHVFPEVGHSFLTDGDHPVAAAISRPVLRVDYQHHVAEDAWQRIMTFFDEHLGREQGAAAVG